MKKLFGILMCIMLLATNTVTVKADEWSVTINSSFDHNSILYDSKYYHVDDEDKNVSIYLSLSDNDDGIASLDLLSYYNPDCLEFVEVKAADGFGDDFIVEGNGENSVGTLLSNDKGTYVKISSLLSDSASVNNITGSGNLIEIVFKIKANVYFDTTMVSFEVDSCYHQTDELEIEEVSVNNIQFATVKMEKIQTNFTVAPLSSDTEYTGEPIALINGNSSIEGGMLEFAVIKDDSNLVPSDDDYKEEVPVAKDPGTYYVYYRVIGYDGYYDEEPVRYTGSVTITRVPYIKTVTQDTNGNLKVEMKDEATAKAVIDGNSEIFVYAGKEDDDTSYKYSLNYNNCYNETGYYPEESYYRSGKYIIVPYKAILANSLPTDNTAKLEIKFKINSENINEQKEFNLSNASKKAVPVTLSEDEDGNIIIESDKDYINALVKAWRVEESTTYGYDAYMGSTIVVQNQSCTFLNMVADYPGLEEQNNTEIEKISSTKAIIRHKTIVKKELPGNESGKSYKFILNAYGYIPVEKELHIDKGCKVLKEGYSVNLADGDIIISSANSEWLLSVMKPYRYSANGTEVESGSVINFAPSFGDGEHDSSFYIKNSIHETGDGDTYVENLMSYVDPEVGDSYIVIPEEVLKALKVENNSAYSLFIYAYGYAEVYINDDQHRIGLGNYCLDVPTGLRIYQDETDYGIHIESTDEDYINALLTPTYDSDTWDYINCNSFITLKNDTDEYVFEISKHGEEVYNCFEYAEQDDKYYAVIDYEEYIADGIKTGEYKVTLHVNGYEDKTLSLVISEGIRKVTDISFAMNDDKDLVITVPEAYLDVFKSEEDTDYAYLVMSKGSYSVCPDLKISDGALIISNEQLRYYGITGTYEFKFIVKGYEDYNATYEIANGLKTVPKDLSVSQDKNGNLLIKTKDTKYLNALMEPTIYTEDEEHRRSHIHQLVKDSDGDLVQHGGDIGNYIYRFEGQEDERYNHMSLSGSTLTIKKDELAVNKWVTDNASVIKLYADGYEYARKSPVKLTGLCSMAEPGEISARYEEGKGIIIESNAAYLKGMVDCDNNYFRSGVVLAYEVSEESWESVTLNNIKTKDYCAKDFYIEGNTLVIPENSLIINELSNKKIKSVTVRSYGFVYSAGCDCDITVPELIKTCDVAVSFNKEGNLVIEAEEAYLKALVKQYNDKNASAGEYMGGLIVVYSNEDIEREYELNILANGLSGIVGYQIKDGKITIAAETIREGITESGKYDIVLDAFGYNEVTRTVDIYVIKAEEGFNGNIKPLESVQFVLEDYEGTVTWELSDNTKGQIDTTGKFTAYKAGKVQIQAKDSLGNVLDTTSVTVSEYRPSGKITSALVDVNENFEVGDIANIKVYDAGEVCNAKLFDYKPDKTSVVSIDEDGHITALSTGTATVKIYYGGTNKLATSIKVTVINRQVNSLSLSVAGYTAGSKGIYLPNNVKTLQLNASGVDKLSDPVNVVNLVYSTSDTSIASVDKTGKVTIKKAGQFTVTATTSTNIKAKGQVSDSVVVRVLDYAPVFETDKITVNRYYKKGTDVNVYAKYADDSIEEAYRSVITGASFTAGSPFTAVYSDGKINIKYNGSETKNKTYSEILTVNVKVGEEEEDRSFNYTMKISVTATLPAVTVKTTGTLNTFTNENSLNAVFTVKDGTPIKEVEFVDGWADYDKENGNVSLIKTDAKGNKITKGNVYIEFEDYTESQVVKSVTFKTVSTAPKYTIDKTSVSLYEVNPAPDAKRDIEIYIKDANKELVTKGTVTGNEVVSFVDGKVTLRVPATGKGGTYKFSYQGEGWSKKIDFSCKVSISNKIPTAKLAVSSLTLNTHFDRDNDTIITTSTGDLISSAVVEYGVKNKTAPEGLHVTFDSNGQKIITTIDDDSVPNGSYKFNITPKINDDEAILKPVTITVKVENSVPTVTFKSTAAKFNIRLMVAGEEPGEEEQAYEEVTTAYTVKNNPYGLTAVGLRQYSKDKTGYHQIDAEESAFGIDGNFENGNFTYAAWSDANGKKEIYLTLIYKDKDNDYVETGYIKFTPTFYTAVPKAAITLKGNLNQIDLDTEVVGTVKYTNLVDTVKSAVLNGTNNDKFSVVVRNGQLIFKLTDAGRALKDGTYKVDVELTSELGIKTTTNVSIKLARKAPTLKLAASTVNVYDMTSIGKEVARVKLNQTGNGKIAAFWVSDSSAYTLERSDNDEYIIVKLKDAAAIKAGSTTKFTIKIDWVGDYGTYEAKTKSIKTTSLTLSVKDASGSVKAK